jgi:LmbE family N-acetylglucosaminyl deacetylase
MKKISFSFFLFFTIWTFAQQPVQWNSAEIYQNIKKLKVQARVLYLAAHPDDENTRFISYCANHMLTETAYISLTRGDGGQNLIGPELREELGLIRTQELLMARAVDGGRQYFSRANDFGYSKNEKETFAIWDKEKVLGDLVYVIRAYQPDIIVCRFPPDGRGGHGHHTASAILGAEAFDLAADPNAFPEQLKEVNVWKTTRLVTNTGRWWNDSISADDPNVVAEDIGQYSSLLGTSCNEIAARSRSLHKSQGFGSTGVRGEQLEYFEHVKGVRASASLFDDIDFSWDRIEGAKKIEKAIDKMLAQFDHEHPEKSIQLLFRLRNSLKKLPQQIRVQEKIEAIEKIILQCGGVFVEAVADKYAVSPLDSVKINIEFIARQTNNFRIHGFSINYFDWDFKGLEHLKMNIKWEQKKTNLIPSSSQYSVPYWLKNEGTLGTYALESQSLVLKPDNGPATFVHVTLENNFEKLVVKIPIVYKENDPVKGELYKPFYVVPAISLQVEKNNVLAKKGETQKIEVKVKSFIDNFSGTWNISAPTGWSVKEYDKKIEWKKKGEEMTFVFEITPSENAQSGAFTPQIIESNGTLYDKEIKFIEYDHIPTQMYLKASSVRINLLDIQKKGQKVAYFEGAGDAIPEALRLVGYTVDILTESDLSRLSEYDAVVLGIRALNVNDRMPYILPKLFEYVKSGGNLILQYNTSHGLTTNEIAPFALKLGRDRVTDESAEVTFLNPNHPVMNTPNKITQNDFENWVQERGLYFPSEWSSEFVPIIACNDPGEKSKEGALLIAPYGEGNYIYTGLSFFRELPEGVPGAYRLLVNLISL